MSNSADKWTKVCRAVGAIETKREHLRDAEWSNLRAAVSAYCDCDPDHLAKLEELLAAGTAALEAARKGGLHSMPVPACWQGGIWIRVCRALDALKPKKEPCRICDGTGVFFNADGENGACNHCREFPDVLASSTYLRGLAIADAKAQRKATDV